MTRILALDTSTWWGGVALVSQDPGSHRVDVVAEIGVQVHGSHAGGLLRWIEWLLAEAAWSRSSLDAFAAARGPGSFTGIRVGLGTIRGLALGSDRPALGVGTLESLAEANGPAESDRVVLLDAGRQELYTARYDADSTPPRPLGGPVVGPPDEILKRETRCVLVSAPGTRIDRDLVGEGCRVAASPRCIAGAVGRLACLQRVERHGPHPPLCPLYVRPPDVRLKRRRS